MLKRIAAASAAFGILVAGQAMAADAPAAQVSAVKGQVLVSQNGKLSSATQTSALRAGDRVVAKDGQATVRFADGCVVTLKSGAMTTVGAASPCAGGAGLVTAGESSAQGFFGSDLGLAVAGWTVLAIGAVLLADDDSDNAVSP